MSSERRIRSSRANGAKSRGPKTPESVARAAAGNLKHGLLARNAVLEAQNPQAFADLLVTFERRLKPQDEAERALVESMAVSRCRLQRVWTAERATLEGEGNAPDPSTQNPALPFGNFELLNRYEVRFDRQLTRCLTTLLEARRRRNKAYFANPPSPNIGHLNVQ